MKETVIIKYLVLRVTTIKCQHYEKKRKHMTVSPLAYHIIVRARNIIIHLVNNEKEDVIMTGDSQENRRNQIVITTQVSSLASACRCAKHFTTSKGRWRIDVCVCNITFATNCKEVVPTTRTYDKFCPHIYQAKIASSQLKHKG